MSSCVNNLKAKHAWRLKRQLLRVANEIPDLAIMRPRGSIGLVDSLRDLVHVARVNGSFEVIRMLLDDVHKNHSRDASKTPKVALHLHRIQATTRVLNMGSSSLQFQRRPWLHVERLRRDAWHLRMFLEVLVVCRVGRCSHNHERVASLRLATVGCVAMLISKRGNGLPELYALGMEYVNDDLK